MITERYTRWVAMLAQSDSNLVILSGLAVAAVVCWHLAKRAPAPWGFRGRLGFMAVSAGVLFQFVTGMRPTPFSLIVGGLVVSLIVVGPSLLKARGQ